MSTFNEYVQDMRHGQTPFLGSLVWFSVPESCTVAHDKLTTLLTEVGLETFGPRSPRDDDVFRRVCTAHARRRVPTNNPDVFENYLVRDVQRANGKVVKQIVVEQVDPANRRLNYDPAVQLTFDRVISKIHTKTLVFDSTGDIQYPQAEAVADLIKIDFRNERGILNAYAVRELVRRVLISCSATVVRPGGGVYFVMSSRMQTIERLEKLTSKLSGCDFQVVPLVDTSKQREMVKAAYESEAVGEIDRTLGEIEELLNGPEITEDRYTVLLNRLASQRVKTKEYSELLDEALGNVDFRIQMYEHAMKSLLNHIRVS